MPMQEEYLGTHSLQGLGSRRVRSRAYVDLVGMASGEIKEACELKKDLLADFEVSDAFTVCNRLGTRKMHVDLYTHITHACPNSGPLKGIFERNL